MKAPVLLLSCLLTACSAAGGFTDAERATIAAQGGGIMHLYTVENPQELELLRAKAAPLHREELASEPYRLLKEGMLATVRDTTNTGVGIAAPQVGISRRLIAVQRLDKAGEPFEFYVNPQIVSYSDEQAEGGEGCLSIPGERGRVRRSQTIVVNHTDEQTLRTLTDTVHGFTAVIFQHEIDHLDGILFTDRIAERAGD